MSLGLRGRILILVLVALAPPTAIAIIVALEERSEARRHAQTDLLDSTRLAAVDAESAVDATANFLSAVADDLSARPGVEHCKRLLALIPVVGALVGLAATVVGLGALAVALWRAGRPSAPAGRPEPPAAGRPAPAA